MDKWDPNAYVKKIKRRFVVLSAYKFMHVYMRSVHICPMNEPANRSTDRPTN